MSIANTWNYSPIVWYFCYAEFYLPFVSPFWSIKWAQVWHEYSLWQMPANLLLSLNLNHFLYGVSNCPNSFHIKNKISTLLTIAFGCVFKRKKMKMIFENENIGNNACVHNICLKTQTHTHYTPTICMVNGFFYCYCCCLQYTYYCCFSH